MPYFYEPPLHGFPDRAHRHLLTNLHNLREFITAAVPGVAPALAVDRARLLTRELPLPDWRKRENDLFFEVPFQAPQSGGVHEVLVGILLEHQTKPDPAMSLRTLVYATAYWDKQWQAWEQIQDQKKPPLRLTPVLPIVFHAGPRKWKAHRTLADLFEPPEPFRPFVPVWQPVFWHLYEQPAEALLQSASPWLQAMAVVRLDAAKPRRFQETCGEAMRHLEPLAAQDKTRWHDLMCFLIAWSKYCRPQEEWSELDVVAERCIMNGELKKEVQTMSEDLRSPFLEWAEKHYGALGKSQGQLLATRENLRGLLERRFGPLPPQVNQRIDACEDFRRLQACVFQVLQMDSLDELQL